MSGDARVDAWVCAWKQLQAAQQLAQTLNTLPPHQRPESLPDDYWGALQTASVCASLVGADADIGEAAAAVLQAQECERRKTNSRLLDIFGKA